MTCIFTAKRCMTAAQTVQKRFPCRGSTLRQAGRSHAVCGNCTFVPPCVPTAEKVRISVQGSNIKYSTTCPNGTDGNAAETFPEVNSKSSLRTLARTRLKALTPARKAEYSGRITCRLSQWELFRKARYIAGFAADSNEPDLSSIFDRRFVFPRWNGHAYEMAHPGWDTPAPWQTGRFGLSEPTGSVCEHIDAEDILWLVPGIAFSPDGGRIGRGAGFYDRLLARARGVFCGVLFECQTMEAVPVEPHDCLLHFLASEYSIRSTAAGDKFFNGRIR